MKTSNKKIKPKNIRNKHVKDIRTMLKNEGRKISAKAIFQT